MRTSSPAQPAGRRAAAREADHGTRVLYVSPLKALAVDVERNLRVPLAGIAEQALREGVAARDSDGRRAHGRHARAASARACGARPADILITTPESLYLLLTSSRARERLATVETVIVDEIHALVPTKRGAHLALSLERLEALRAAGRAARSSASGSAPRSAPSTRSRASSGASRAGRPAP